MHVYEFVCNSCRYRMTHDRYPNAEITCPVCHDRMRCEKSYDADWEDRQREIRERHDKND